MRIIRRKKPLVDSDGEDPEQVMTCAVDDFSTTPPKTSFADFTITSKYGALLKKVENVGCPVKTRPPPTHPSHFALRASRDRWQGEGSHSDLQPLQRLPSLTSRIVYLSSHSRSFACAQDLAAAFHAHSKTHFSSQFPTPSKDSLHLPSSPP